MRHNLTAYDALAERLQSEEKTDVVVATDDRKLGEGTECSCRGTDLRVIGRPSSTPCLGFDHFDASQAQNGTPFKKEVSDTEDTGEVARQVGK